MCIRQNIKLSLSHALLYSFTILSISFEIHFRENWLIFLGIWGEAELFY